MKLKTGLVVALGMVWVLVLAGLAGADFFYVRSLPAPHIPDRPDHIAGLDNDGSDLLVVSTYTYPSDSAGGSRFFLVSPVTGEVERQEDYPGAPALCESNYPQLTACACYAGARTSYWAADTCGEIDLFAWPESIMVGYSFTLAGAPRPISMVTNSDTLFVLDSFYNWVVRRYYVGETAHTDTVHLAGFSGVPCAITIWRDHLLVAARPAEYLLDSPMATDVHLWEYTEDGALLKYHDVYGVGSCWPNEITSIGDDIYIAGGCGDIVVLQPSEYHSEVPPGDSVVVDAVPGRVEVTFDSVSTGGSFTGEIADSDSCPPPDGVNFFSDFFHLVTTAQFDYAAETALSDPGGLPPGVDLRRVRVFARPSGTCQPYFDVTTEFAEESMTLINLTRNKSEEDEFSVFALGEDLRPPRAAIDLKFGRLEAAVDGGEDSIPPVPLARIRSRMATARDEYYRGLSPLAADHVDSVAITARGVSQIPHTFDPEVPGRNLAGRLISYAHTLAFSLRFSESVAMMTDAYLVPEHVDQSPDGFIRSYQDVPPEFGSVDVDNQHIYLEHLARAIPESTSVETYAIEGGKTIRRVRAVFHADDVEAVTPPVSVGRLRLTASICGYQVFSDPTVYGPGAGVPDAVTGQVAPLVVKPNPSASSFVFEVASSGNQPVRLCIYSVRGELVRVLTSDGPRAGVSTLAWHGDNQDGVRVAPGTYFVSVRLGGGTITRKVVLRP
ncbi:MAG TPA: T9SS type A sorting domain-containing protein [bacterium]|nr:T9SS type A sorting domain-containing protein [bacterium]